MRNRLSQLNNKIGEVTMNIPGMGDMGGMMKQLEEMQNNMKKAEEELANLEIEGTAGGDLVKVTLNGHYGCAKVNIDDSALKDDKEMLEDLITAAINDAVHKVGKEKKEKMSNATGDIKMPAGFDLPMK